MSAPVSTESGASRFPSLAGGVALAVAGAVILLLVSKVTHGVALAALAGMGLFVLVQRRRGARASRVLLWAGACAAAALAYGVVVARLYWSMPNGQLTAVIDSARKVQDTATPPRIPEALERALGGRERFEQSARLNRLWATSRAGFIWALLMGTTIGLAVVGIVVGTVAWAGIVLVFKGILLLRGPPGS